MLSQVLIWPLPPHILQSCSLLMVSCELQQAEFMAGRTITLLLQQLWRLGLWTALQGVVKRVDIGENKDRKGSGEMWIQNEAAILSFPSLCLGWNRPSFRWHLKSLQPFLKYRWDFREPQPCCCTNASSRQEQKQELPVLVAEGAVLAHSTTHLSVLVPSPLRWALWMLISGFI